MPPMATTTMTTDSITRRFAVACGVLSQYVKAAAPPPASSGAMALMGTPAAVVQEPNAQQLTIFYGGRVLVLDGCTPARAAELIRYAAAAAPTAAKGSAEPALVDMPIARKASLKRFLAKRKDRAVAAARAPYFRTEEATSKKTKAEATSEEPSTWLALGSLGDMHAAARAVIASTSHSVIWEPSADGHWGGVV